MKIITNFTDQIEQAKQQAKPRQSFINTDKLNAMHAANKAKGKRTHPVGAYMLLGFVSLIIIAGMVLPTLPPTPAAPRYTRDDVLAAMLTSQMYGRTCAGDDRFHHERDTILHLEGDTPAMRAARFSIVDTYQRMGHAQWCAHTKARMWMGDDYRKYKNQRG